MAYTYRIARVDAALLLAVYREYLLWYVPRDIIAFARKLGFAMDVPPGSRANLCKLLELLDYFE